MAIRTIRELGRRAIIMKRIALWSGPRNISTAMMRAWGNRPDTVVCDEPLYGHYLLRTGLAHPGAQDIIQSQECDWRKVVQWLLGPLPPGKTLFYQKQMAHHLLPEIGTDWLHDLVNCFLIRDPSEMLASLIHFIPRPTIRDTGLLQQVQIFELARQSTSAAPVVLDARDVLASPRAMLMAFCAAVDVEFTESMLQWPAGRRDKDGVWAQYWYAKVEQTTTFEPYRPKHTTLPAELTPLLDECEQLYRLLFRHRLEI